MVNKLKEQVSKTEIVALVRTPEKAQDLGVSAREANYDNPEILDRALKGVDALLLISSSEVGKRAAQQHNVIEAAKKMPRTSKPAGFPSMWTPQWTS